MNKKIKYLVFLILTIYGSVYAEEYVTGVSELGTTFKLSKTEWPKAFTCNHYGGPKAGKFMFSIRKKKTKTIGSTNAWLIFSDYSGYAGNLYRDGLDWRFDWEDRNTKNNFTIKIKSGGQTYYYDWSLADGDGRMSVLQSAYCK